MNDPVRLVVMWPIAANLLVIAYWMPAGKDSKRLSDAAFKLLWG